MGTHPIFESDFDCLTEWVVDRVQDPGIENEKKKEKDLDHVTEKKIENEVEVEIEKDHVIKNAPDHVKERDLDHVRKLKEYHLNQKKKLLLKNTNQKLKQKIQIMEKVLKKCPDFQADLKHSKKQEQCHLLIYLKSTLMLH